MALVVKDRVKETTTTTGTGAITLAGAVAGFQAFSGVLSDSDTTYYAIVHRDTAEFEVGLGTYSSSTLTRTTVLESSNSGNAVNFTGNINTSGYLRGPSTFTIDPAAHGDDTGTLVVAGNLQVDGTTTTINSTTVTLDDKNLVLASGAANAAAANGAGLTIDGASATLTYADTGDKFIFNKSLDVTGTTTATTFAGQLSGTITSATTGTTQSGSDNSTKLATTEYTDRQASDEATALAIALG